MYLNLNSLLEILNFLVVSMALSAGLFVEEVPDLEDETLFWMRAHPLESII
jgi:hypothetical protein